MPVWKTIVFIIKSGTYKLCYKAIRDVASAWLFSPSWVYCLGVIALIFFFAWSTLSTLLTSHSTPVSSVPLLTKSCSLVMSQISWLSLKPSPSLWSNIGLCITCSHSTLHFLLIFINLMHVCPTRLECPLSVCPIPDHNPRTHWKNWDRVGAQRTMLTDWQTDPLFSSFSLKSIANWHLNQSSTYQNPMHSLGHPNHACALTF